MSRYGEQLPLPFDGWSESEEGAISPRGVMVPNDSSHDLSEAAS